MKKQNFKLIDGVFEPADAKKMIVSLINNKINYHNLEDFSNHIRFNEDLVHSQKRVSELQEAKNNIAEIVEFAEQNKMKLELKSIIEINLLK